jgi:hypothetical protein
VPRAVTLSWAQKAYIPRLFPTAMLSENKYLEPGIASRSRNQREDVAPFSSTPSQFFKQKLQ